MEAPHTVSSNENLGYYFTAPKNDLWQNVAKIALKVASVAIIAIGAAVAIGGAIIFTNRVISSGILEPLLLPSVWAAREVAHLSFMLLSNNVTALGAMATFPLAGVCLTPFLLPASIGALPGAGIIALGVRTYHYPFFQ